MANIKITSLTSASVITSDDLFVVVNDPSGVPVTQKATAQTLLSYITASTFTGLTLNSSSVIDVSTTNPALRVTQRGTGESIRVEDQTNPDATPFIVGSDGNVGIGTSVPGTFLHVSGNWTNPNYGVARFEGSDAIVVITDSTTATRYAALTLGTAGGAFVLSNGLSTGSSNSDLYITRGHDGSDRRFRFARDSGGGLGIINSTNQHESIFLYPAGDSYFLSGNVGIGTSSPTKKLHVTGSDALINTITVGLGNSNVATNTAVGLNALNANNTIGVQNVAIGYEALALNQSGGLNTAIGYQALRNLNNLASGSNTAVGFGSLSNNQESANTAVGRTAMQSNINGTQNTATGMNALRYNIAGNNNVAFGYSALQNNVSGSFNVVIGAVAGGSLADLTNASNNTFIGMNAGASLITGSNNVFLGYNAGSGITSISDTFILTLGANERMRINSAGNVGIGTNTPSQKLDIVGNISITGSIESNRSDTGEIFNSYNSSAGAIPKQFYIRHSFANVELGNSRSNGNIFITSSNVGIGTNSPVQTLSVTGTLGVSGNTTIANGNLIFGTTGKGIDFSITPNSGTATNSELLNDYEEGTWTPQLSGTTTVGSYTYSGGNAGTYTKIGNMVQASCYLATTARTTALTGNVNITGLPFPIAGAYRAAGNLSYYSINTSVGGLAALNDNNSSTFVTLYRIPAGGGSFMSFFTGSASDELGATPSFIFNITYRTFGI